MSFNEWEYIDASDFCQKVTDGTHDSPKSQNAGKHLITSKHIKGRTIDFDSAYLISLENFTKINKRSQVNQWDVLISMIGEYCGYCYVERNDFIDYAVKNVGIFKIGNKLKAEWIYYYLNSPEGKASLASLKSGTSQPYISLGSLRDLKILVPKDENEISRITSILSSLDDKIELNRQTNQTLEAIAQTLFQEMCVPKGDELPEGWKIAKLESICTLITKGTTPTTYGNKFVDGGVNFLRVDCILDSENINLSKALFIDEATHEKLKRSQLKEKDILVTIAGSIARIGYVTNRILPANTNQAIALVRVNLELIPPLFIYQLFKKSATKERLLSGITQSVQANISLADIRNLEIVIPNPEILERFENAIAPIISLYELYTEETQTLTALRDSLLPKLMKGEIEVKGIF